MNDPDAFLQLDVPEGSCAHWEIPAVGYALDAAWYSHVQSRHLEGVRVAAIRKTFSWSSSC
jgi:hypothetical protein